MLKRCTAAGDQKAHEDQIKIGRERNPEIPETRAQQAEDQQPDFAEALRKHAGRYFQQGHGAVAYRAQKTDLRVIEPEHLRQDRQQYVLQRNQAILDKMRTATGDQHRRFASISQVRVRSSQNRHAKTEQQARLVTIGGILAIEQANYRIPGKLNVIMRFAAAVRPW